MNITQKMDDYHRCHYCDCGGCLGLYHHQQEREEKQQREKFKLIILTSNYFKILPIIIIFLEANLIL